MTVAISFYCISVVPSGSPQTLTSGAVTATSLQVNWQPPSLSDQNGVITGYVINITSLNTGVSQQLTSTTTSLQVSSLTPFTNYVCIVAAMTAIGVGPFSTVVTVQTLEGGIYIIVMYGYCHKVLAGLSNT